MSSESEILHMMTEDAAASHVVVKSSYWFPDGESSGTVADVHQCSADSCTCDPSSAKNIDSTLFTHLFCAYADIDTQTHEVSFRDSDQRTKFSTFTEIVRKKNKKVYTLLSIGGRNADNSKFASMATNSDFRKSFIDSSIATAREFKFHGLDLAWEYPSNAVEMANFGILLQEWRTAIDDESEETGMLPLLLTAAVFYSPKYKTFTYPIKDIVDNLDWVNVIAFDFYGPGWSKVTGPPAALYETSGPSGDSGLQQWFKDGLPENKVVFGFPYVGWAWTLEDVKDNGYDAPTTGPAISATGSINYNKVRNYIVSNGAATMHEPRVTGDYCYAAKTWIAYDDNQSIVKKVKYAKEKSLRGYFAWHIGADYDCGLSRAASRAWDATDVITVPVHTEE